MRWNKKEKEVIVQNNGLGFASILTLIFITLKLTNVISWSWWWVLSPLWISAGLGLLIFLIALTVLFIKESK